MRIPAVENVSLDEIVLPRLAQLDLQPGSVVWVGPPRERIPPVQLYYDDTSGESHEEWLDPRTRKVLGLTDSGPGSEFFFDFHFIIPFSGLLILATSYFSWSMAVPFNGDFLQLDAELLTYERPMIEPAGEPGQSIYTLDGYISRANEI